MLFSDTARSLRAETLRYGALTKRRLRRSGEQTGLRCQICGAPRPPYESITHAEKSELVKEVSVCEGCGYVQIKELSSDRYRGKTDISQLPGGGARIGTEEAPGREFKMARMALDILGGEDHDVMVYGIGRSLDNHHIAALHRVRDVAIGDIMKVRDDAEFHDANKPATRQFPIVIASEVIEHFRSPHEDFAKLFQFVSRDGLLVCGTNVYGGGDLTRDRYPFWPDHTSYYTPAALLEVARTHGFFLDFRTPQIGLPHGRKRYVLFTRSPRVLQQVSLYFGQRTVAPSE